MKVGEIVEFDHDVKHLFWDIEPQHKQYKDVLCVVDIIKGLICTWVFLETCDKREISVPINILKKYRSKLINLIDDEETQIKLLLRKHNFYLDIMVNIEGAFSRGYFHGFYKGVEVLHSFTGVDHFLEFKRFMKDLERELIYIKMNYTDLIKEGNHETF